MIVVMSDEMDAVKSTARRWRSADKARDRARDDHFAAVLAALRAGEVPTEVYGESPFTATHLRGLARDAGIPRGKKRPRGSGTQPD
jgi:hypothetical protein